MIQISRAIATFLILFFVASHAYSQDSRKPADFEVLDTSKRYHYSMVKTLDGEIVEDSEMVLQYLGQKHGENLHNYLFEYIVGDDEYLMVFTQMITDRASYTYGFVNPDTLEVDVDEEWFIDLKSPLKPGTKWSFSLLYPGKPKVIEHEELRYSFELEISQWRETFELGDLEFHNCFDVEQSGSSEKHFTLHCDEQSVEGAIVRMNITRTYCLGHGAVLEKAEQFVEKRGIRLESCSLFSYVSELIKTEDVP